MYSTIGDLKTLMPEAQLLELADDGVDSPTPEQVMLEAIEQADREIDGYLGAVHEVPLDPVPPMVANISAKIAVWNLNRRRPHLEPGSWGDEYPRQLNLLKLIAQGKLTLGMEQEGGTVQPLELDKPVMKTRDREFPDELLEEF
jgi:phage gp36-like protein